MGTTVHTFAGTLGHLQAWFSQDKCVSRLYDLGAILGFFRLTSEGSLVRTQLRPPAQTPSGPSLAPARVPLTCHYRFGGSSSSAASARWIMPLIESATRRPASVVAWWYIIAARTLSWPMRSIRSRRLSPPAAASVLPVCRRSWKCRLGAPIAATAAYQPTSRRKLLRRSVPPRVPENSSTADGWSLPASR